MLKNNVFVLTVLNSVLLVFLNIVIWMETGTALAMLCTAVTMLIFAFVLLVIDRMNRRDAEKYRLECMKADSSTRKMMLELPVPCVLSNKNGEVLWYNFAASEIFENREISGERLSELFEGGELVKGDKGSGNTVIGLKSYEYCFSGCGEDDDMHLITFVDVTEVKTLSEKCSALRCVACYITIDNYSEVMSDISGNEAGKLAIDIEEKLIEAADRACGVLHRLEKDRYFMVLDMEHLVVLMADKFSVLNAVKEIKGSNDIPVTVSIGAGFCDESAARSGASAKAALELALGRGGDQAVVKINDELRFFGGSSRETEKKTKVRARVMAQALCEIIGNAGQVIIMGHKNPDADSFGAAVGIFGLAESLGVRAKIIIDSSNSVVRREMERFEELKEYNFAFISAEQALSIMNDKTVIVLVDTHRADRAEAPGLFNLTSKTIVIDHHRRSADYLKNTILTYHEPYASSTSEMVSEILQYTDYGSILKKQEAEALFAGITLDTKNFTVKTGVRTFDAAAFLRKRGVDTNSVREIFKTGLDDYKRRMEIVNNADIYRNITVVSKSQTADIETCAAAADELLNISGIGASFVITALKDDVHISARSAGEINVQLIAEMLGGGGHMTVAGAQLENFGLDDAERRLKEVIDSYFAESY